MQSFTFDQLDERGQSNAIVKYGQELLDACGDIYYTKDRLKRFAKVESGWRFTEHGERVA